MAAAGDEAFSKNKLDFRIQLPETFEETFKSGERCDGGHPDLYEDVDGDDDTEIWLIRAPVGLDPSDFNGQVVSLDKKTSLKSSKMKTKYNMTFDDNISHQLKSNIVLLPDLKSGQYTPLVKSIEGCLSVTMAMTNPTITYPKITINDPVFPEGLKVRYKPFGSNKPVDLNALSNKSKSKKRGNKDLSKDAAAVTTPKKAKVTQVESSSPSQQAVESDQDIFILKEETELKPKKKSKKK